MEEIVTFCGRNIAMIRTANDTEKVSDVEQIEIEDDKSVGSKRCIVNNDDVDRKKRRLY